MKTAIVTVTASICGSIIASPACAESVRAEKPKTVSVIEANWKGVQNLVAAHKGKVVVVDIWMTTCGGCLKKFPDFMALRKIRPGKIALISVNGDFDGIPGKPPKHYRPGVLKFLRKQNATFENVMLNVPFLGFMNMIKLESTPAMFVFDKTGKLVKRFDNDKAEKTADEFTMKQVAELVAKLTRKE